MLAQIRMKAIIRWRKGKIFGMTMKNVGTMMAKESIAIVEPMRVNFTAWCPLPLMSNLCPGKIPSPVSSSGAPRKIDGMKLRKV